ncbi:unnamed protein product [Haemonchus placei]|uniref:Uncharacterized protein n=1 Tax=Haemonchus placei TaxID=6290 RepID=A0A0N4X6W6_HAEPC|nr:unnamed protein product [Haemonchus placei]
MGDDRSYDAVEKSEQWAVCRRVVHSTSQELWHYHCPVNMSHRVYPSGSSILGGILQRSLLQMMIEHVIELCLCLAKVRSPIHHERITLAAYGSRAALSLPEMYLYLTVGFLMESESPWR